MSNGSRILLLQYLSCWAKKRDNIRRRHKLFIDDLILFLPRILEKVTLKSNMETFPDDNLEFNMTVFNKSLLML